jgi:diguanylate cyclase (GGDEF)-like protein
MRRAVAVPYALAALLAAGCVPLLAFTADRSFIVVQDPLPGYLGLVVLAVGFGLAELGLVHVEFRRQAYSYALAGLPLAVGLAWFGPREVVIARTAGSLVAFVVQRTSVVKVAYNVAAYAFEAALGGFVLHEIWGSDNHLDLGHGAGLTGTVAAVDLIIGVLVIVVIWAQGTEISPRQVLTVLLPALAFSLASSTLALTGLIMAARGSLGVSLLVLAAAMAVLAHYSYQVLHRRHLALALVHDFVEHSEAADSLDQLAMRLLTRARHLLSAGRAELVLFGAGDLAAVRLGVGEDDVLQTVDDEGTDWLMRRVLEQDEPILVKARTRDAGLRRWLQTHQATEAMVVSLPLPGDARRGLLLVFDRLGDTSSFTAEDLTLLQTMAGHLSVALQNTELVQRLRHEATHDVLTGLANRSLLAEHLAASLAGPGPTTVMMLDLDRFKEVNDALGHPVGDKLLEVIASRLLALLPDEAVVARLGGDEFAVLLPTAASATGHLLLGLADEVRTVIAEPVPLPEATIVTQASIGVAVAVDGESADDVLRHADTAMYAAKNAHDRLVLYSAELDRGRAEKLALLADLQIALTRDELELHYQPQLSLSSGRITGVEALVRWRHPRLGLLSPDVFIPLAESGGLIDKLTLTVLGQATTQCRHWYDLGLDVTVAVNLSARGVASPLMCEAVAGALASSGLPPDRLILEITESSVMGDPAQTVPALNRLVALGVSLSLDDFGTGYSSLAYLQRLPVREIKIDRSFVLGLADPHSAHASEVLIRSIIALGTSLGLTVVAEGVEDEDMLQLLRRLGCDLAQGYHICRPTEPVALTHRLMSDAVRAGRTQPTRRRSTAATG